MKTFLAFCAISLAFHSSVFAAEPMSLINGHDLTGWKIIGKNSNEWQFGTAVGDINGDGKPDLVVGISSGGIYTNGIIVLTNDGSGNFTIATRMSVSEPWAEAIADLNGDGKPDIVVANPGSSEIAVFFQTPLLSITSQPTDVIVSWPAIWTNWVLQQNADVSTTNWSTTSNSTLNDGTNNTTSMPLSCSNLFFRLTPPR